LLRLASEALRIHLAHLFDPFVAVRSSQIEALPHQLTAVYGEMLMIEEVRFGEDSPLEEAVQSELVSEAQIPC
jgi:hypothetical protein